MASNVPPANNHMKRRYRSLAIALLLLVVLTVVQPLLWRLVKRQAEAVHARRTIEQQRMDVAERNERVRGDLTARQESLGVVDAIAPEFTQLPQAVERLELLADRRALSIEIQGINQGVVSSSDALQPVTVSMRVFGPIETLYDFMEQLEHVQELTRLESWQLQPTSAPPSVEVADSLNNYVLAADVVFYLQNQSYGKE